ncbi:unnamed protein product [Laminaria digitata]
MGIKRVCCGKMHRCVEGKHLTGGVNTTWLQECRRHFQNGKSSILPHHRCFARFGFLFQPTSLFVRGSEAITRDCRTHFLDSVGKGFCWVQPCTRQPRGGSSPVKMSKYPVSTAVRASAATSTPHCTAFSFVLFANVSPFVHHWRPN